MKSKPRAFMTAPHPGAAFSTLAAAADARRNSSSAVLTPEQLVKELEDADAVVSVVNNRFDDAVFSRLPRLKAVANVAVGFDNIDVESATRRGILIINTPGVLNDTTADLAFALLLAAARRIAEADRYVRDGKWVGWNFDLFLGTDVRGKTLGIIGLGGIGQAMARRALAFGMKIVYNQRRRLSAEQEQSLGAARHVPLDDLLKQSDSISIHCPLTKDTYHLLAEREFGLTKPGCILINTARGAVVDEAAMVQALRSGRLHAAGLDVFEREPQVSPELLTMENVVLAPHIGSASVETRSAMAQLAVDGLVSALTGVLPPNAVNPEVWGRFCERMERVCG